MHQYALKIRKSDLPLLAVLNGGLEPKIQKGTYLLITIEDSEHTHTEIVTERELAETREFNLNGPLLLKLKK